MKLLIACLMAIIPLLPLEARNDQGGQDSTKTVIDSLNHYYRAQDAIVFLNDTIVPYTVVLHPVEEGIAPYPEFVCVGGWHVPFEAIRRYGEKYRKGILFFRKNE
ncbi:MAG: hypothetical protein LBN29_00385 [Mediterranea sp.]|nr:hypothetical protein [Mediterranea sp.]